MQRKNTADKKPNWKTKPTNYYSLLRGIKSTRKEKKKGLQKISNDTLRKAYIDEQLIKERKNLDKIENRRKQLLRKYEIDLELFKYELQVSLIKQGGSP